MKLEKDKIIIAVAVICVIIFGILYYSRLNVQTVLLPQADAPPVIYEPEEPGDASAQRHIMVHVTGEVKSPGVYELSAQSRIQDALALAGGPTEDADLNRINLAAFVSDAQQIVVPKVRADGEPEYYIGETENKLININTADIRELTALPGIGEVIAGNIVAYRERNGNFKQKSDIKNVTRIGERIFEQIEGLITTE